MNKKDFKKYTSSSKINVCSMCLALGRNAEERHHYVIYENLKERYSRHEWLCEEHLNQIITLNPDVDPFITKLLKILHEN